MTFYECEGCELKTCKGDEKAGMSNGAGDKAVRERERASGRA
jgi:hypothetical protein